MSKLPRKISWLKELVAGLAAASGIGYLATAYTLSRWLTRSARCRPHPSPDKLGLDWSPLECTTDDDLVLRGWVVAPPRPRATIALFHGLRQNRTQTLDRMALLVGAGYRCVAFDHRAHGQSKGRHTTFGFREAGDVAAVLDLIHRCWPNEKCAALGISMGAAALCFAAPQVRELDAVILESLYHDLGSTFQNRIGSRFPAWFARFRRGVVWVTERRLGLRLRQIAPVEHIAGLAPAPVLLITGAADLHAPPHDAERLFARCGEPRELALIPGAGHMNLAKVGGQRYREVILGFLDRQFGQVRQVA